MTYRSNHLSSHQPPCLAPGMPACNAMDVLSLIEEGDEQSAQAKNPRRRPQARGRGSSERLNVLSLIGEGEEQPPQPRTSRGRPRARGRGRGNSGRPVASAMDVLARGRLSSDRQQVPELPDAAGVYDGDDEYEMEAIFRHREVPSPTASSADGSDMDLLR